MAIDIDLFVEVLNDHTKKWELIGNQFCNPNYNPEINTIIDEDGYEQNSIFIDTPYQERSYELFSILADVTKEEENQCIPISIPRGFPYDMSKALKNKIEREIGNEYFSSSYLTLAELLNYNWLQVIIKNEIVPFELFKQVFHSKAKPHTYFGGIVSDDAKILEEEQAIQYLHGLPEGWVESNVYVRYQWEAYYKDEVGTFLTHAIPALKILGSPHNVRIVFAFNN